MITNWPGRKPMARAQKVFQLIALCLFGLDGIMGVGLILMMESLSRSGHGRIIPISIFIFLLFGVVGSILLFASLPDPEPKIVE